MDTVKCIRHGRRKEQMAVSGRYIGTPNGIVLCVHQKQSGRIRGHLYHGYTPEGIFFHGYEELIKAAEGFFDSLGFPHMETGNRDIRGHMHRIQKKEGMVRIMRDEELLEQHGDIGTFVIRVQHRQHSSWQGRVTCLERDQTVYFRSVLELMKIIDGVLDETEQERAVGLE